MTRNESLFKIAISMDYFGDNASIQMYEIYHTVAVGLIFIKKILHIVPLIA